MAGFYVGMGVVTLLLVAGYFAWTPLRLGYAICRVQCEEDQPGVEDASRWMLACLKAAQAGNAPAMRAVMARTGDHVLVGAPDGTAECGREVAYLAARAQPERFVEYLSSEADERALEVAYHVLFHASLEDAGIGHGMCSELAPSVFGITVRTRHLMSSSDPLQVRLAQLVDDHVRARFPDRVAAFEAWERTLKGL
jgi:hypothetical protein